MHTRALLPDVSDAVLLGPRVEVAATVFAPEEEGLDNDRAASHLRSPCDRR